MKTLRLHKFIAITLCVTLLTVSASRVTRVSAVGTTIAAVAGAATLAVGIGFLSYAALSGMAINCPNTMDDIKEWLTGVGEKVVLYPSGSRAYNDIYTQMINEPATAYLDHAWSWTKDKLLDFANDFVDTRIITNILGYDDVVSVSVDNGYDYTDLPFDTLINGQPLAANQSIVELEHKFILNIHGLSCAYNPDYTLCRNSYDGSRYYIELSYDGTHWTRPTYISQAPYAQLWVNGSYYAPLWVTTLYNDANSFTTSAAAPQNAVNSWDTPIYAEGVIYDSVHDEDLPYEIVPVTERQLPSWTDPDNNNRPIIPWVPIPDIPVDIPNPPVFENPPTWGFPLQDLLDLLAELGQMLFNLLALKELLNEYAGQHGDTYYISYDDSENNINYYTYYQISNYDGDTVTYNIDVSHADEQLPVDLNTIQLYTNNRYLDEVKRSAVAGSSIIRDLVVFVYDIDPGIVYVFFGSCLAILIAAFIGKWGHS